MKAEYLSDILITHVFSRMTFFNKIGYSEVSGINACTQTHIHTKTRTGECEK